MKKDIYSCLKVIESLRKSLIPVLESNAMCDDEMDNVILSYKEVRKILIKNLGGGDAGKFIPDLDYCERMPIDRYRAARSKGLEFLQKLLMAISYIRSLEGSYEEEINKKKSELERNEKELKYQKKLLDKSIEALKELPEALRSGVVLDIKKKHRDIEKHTKK